MPCGKTHTKITYWTCLPVAALVWYFYGPLISLIVLISYIFAGQMFNGDLDCRSGPYLRWGLLKFIWKPYQGFRHRSFYTHGLLVGTAIRLAWITVIIAPFFLIFDFSPVYLYLRGNGDFVLAVLFGLEAGAMSHSIADWTT